jgi:hypothetical protein
MELLRKSIKAELKQIEEEILQEATDNLISEIVVDGNKYKLKYDHKIHVKELVSDHSAKVELYKRLAELGYDEAVFFESAYYPATKLKKVWAELEPDTIIKLAEDGLIYHETVPSITTRKAKD